VLNRVGEEKRQSIVRDIYLDTDSPRAVVTVIGNLNTLETC
jgi:hypothetical protein